METAWRINSGRIETFYQPTNEPMYVYTLLSQNGDNVTIRMNGTLDDDLQATLTLTKKLYEGTPRSTTEESYYTNKEQVLSIRNTCYAYCAGFEEAQLKLEEIRTNSSTVHDITPSTSDVKKAWEAGYTTIRYTNILLDHKDSFGSLFSTQELNELLAEIRFIRAFVYYNLTMTWGDVPWIRTASGDVDTYAPVEAYWLKSEYLDYGYWTALKRMGKAQTVTGCYDYELLMPIPANELALNPSMTQNPGY